MKNEFCVDPFSAADALRPREPGDQTAVPPVPQDSELHRLRVELRRQLALQQKQSLYSVLGVQADSSDAAIADVSLDAPLAAQFHGAQN